MNYIFNTCKLVFPGHHGTIKLVTQHLVSLRQTPKSFLRQEEENQLLNLTNHLLHLIPMIYHKANGLVGLRLLSRGTLALNKTKNKILKQLSQNSYKIKNNKYI